MHGARESYTNGRDTVVLERADDGTSFTGGVIYLNSTEAVAGIATSEQRAGVSSVLDVNTSPIGSGEKVDGPIVNREEWTIGEDQSLAVGDRFVADSIVCNSIAEQADALIQFIGIYPTFLANRTTFRP